MMAGDAGRQLRVAVSGADGFVGRWLVEALTRAGHHVVAITRDGTSVPGASESVVCPLSQYGELSEHLSGLELDTFVHLAWDGVEGQAFLDYRRQLDNAAAAVAAAIASHEAGVQHFIQVGSVNEYEIVSLDQTPARPRMTQTYSAAKLAAAHMGRAFAGRLGMKYNEVRLAMVYGQGNRSSMLPNVVIRQLIGGETPQLIKGEGLYDLIHASEAADGILAVAERGHDQQTYFVGHRSLLTFRDIVERIRDVVAPAADLNFGAYPEENSLNFDLIDLDALWRDTGYECAADFEVTVRDTADWLKENS